MTATGAARGSNRAEPPPLTPDGRYIVVGGRLWRAADPDLTAQQHDLLVSELMIARRAAGVAKRSRDAVAEAAAHDAVDAAKHALGERGAPWWSDGAPDLNRHLVKNTDYARWYEALTAAQPDWNDADGRIAIGTAGWSIPRGVAHAFPGQGSHLQRYAAVMNVAEINSSFYRPHRRATYERWAASTPGDFRFAVKMPKAISHIGKLVDVDVPLDAFIEQIGGLGARLGVVLLQLPPSLAFDRRVASDFLRTLRLRLDPAIEIATEPRHATWFTEQADTCLAEHRVARVIADPVLAPGGELPGGWAGLRYHRLHGSPRVYYSSYDPQQLAALADALAHDRDAGVKCWCIFDNTASGAAVSDALTLRSLLTRSEPR